MYMNTCSAELQNRHFIAMQTIGDIKSYDSHVREDWLGMEAG